MKGGREEKRRGSGEKEKRELEGGEETRRGGEE